MTLLTDQRLLDAPGLLTHRLQSAARLCALLMRFTSPILQFSSALLTVRNPYTSSGESYLVSPTPYFRGDRILNWLSSNLDRPWPCRSLVSVFNYSGMLESRTHTTLCKSRAPVSPPARIIYHRLLCQTSATRRAPFTGYTVLPDSDLWKYWNAAPTSSRF